MYLNLSRQVTTETVCFMWHHIHFRLGMVQHFGERGYSFSCQVLDEKIDTTLVEQLALLNLIVQNQKSKCAVAVWSPEQILS